LAISVAMHTMVCHRNVPRGLPLQQLPLESVSQNILEMRYPCYDDFGESPRDCEFPYFSGDLLPKPALAIHQDMAEVVKSDRPRVRGRNKGRKQQQQYGVPPQHSICARPTSTAHQQGAESHKQDGWLETSKLLPLCTLASSTSLCEDRLPVITIGTVDPTGAIASTSDTSEACTRSSNRAISACSMDKLAWPREATTVMVRNIPNRYKADEVLAEMLVVGFAGTFDFYYLPFDFVTKRNRGYAFVNFCEPADACRFVHAFHGQRLTRYSTRKIIEVSPAVSQGFDANVAQHVRKDSHRILNPWFRPMIFPAAAN